MHSTTIKNEGLINAQDKEIWDFAKLNNYVIVTQDSDFNDLNSLYGFPPKIIWLRAGNLDTETIVKILKSRLSEINKFLADKNFGCLEIYRIKS